MKKHSRASWVLVALAVVGAIAAAILGSTHVLSGWAAGVLAAFDFVATLIISVATNIWATRIDQPERVTPQTRTVLDDLVDRPLEVQHDLERTLANAHEAVSVATGVEPSRIGAHCWIIHGNDDDLALERIARYRPGTSPPNLQRRFQRKFGLVGWCWHNGHWETEDLRGLVGLRREAYASLTAEEKKGRPYETLLRSIRDFSVILAVPMYDRLQLYGVISLNFDSNVRTPRWTLESDAVRRAIEEAAAACARLLRQAGAL